MTPRSFVVRSVLALLLCGSAVAPAFGQAASTWFLAEGASNGTFDEDILVGNPSATALGVTVTLLPAPDAVITPGAVLEKTFTLPGTGRLTVNIRREFPGLSGATSARISAAIQGSTTPADIVVERSMFFPLTGTPYAGGTSASGVTAPATRWILAEGASGVFETFILIANPGTTAASVTARYLRGNGTSLSETFTVQPGNRETRWPSSYAGLAGEGFSTVVESSAPVVAERAMYFDSFRSGHDALGVTEGRTTWYFAEGFTGGNATIAFETFLLVGNDNDQPATVTATFFRDTGAPITRTYTVLPRSRFNIWTDQEKDSAGALLLPATAFSVRLESTIPIVAERAMYWGTPSAADPTTPSFPWKEGHVVAGIRQPEAKWAFAEGRQGDDPSGVAFDSFFLLVNPNTSPMQVRATFVTEDGTGFTTTATVAANARANIWPTPGAGPDADSNTKFALLQGRRFACFLESVGGETFVAERAMYWSTFVGGHANAGTPWSGTIAAPAQLPADVKITGMNPTSGRLTGGTVVTITGENFGGAATVTFGGVPVTPSSIGPAAITFTVPTRTPQTGFGSAGPVAVTVSAQGRFLKAPSFTRYLSVLAFGDSLTWGVSNIYNKEGVKEQIEIRSPYPLGLKELLVANPRFGDFTLVTNAGWPGEWASLPGFNSSPGGVTRFGRCIRREPNCLFPTAPPPFDYFAPFDAVVILEGINDLNNEPTPATTVRTAIGNMALQAKESGSQVLLALFDSYGIDRKTGEPATFPAKVNQFNALLSQLAQDIGVSREWFTGIGMCPDGLHPDQRGYDEMAMIAHAKLLTMFPRCPAGQSSCP